MAGESSWLEPQTVLEGRFRPSWKLAQMAVGRFAVRGANLLRGPQSAPKQLPCVPQSALKGRSEALCVIRRTKQLGSSDRLPPVAT